MLNTNLGVKKLRAGVTSVTFTYLSGYILSSGKIDSGIGTVLGGKGGCIATPYQNNNWVGEEGFRSTLDENGKMAFYLTRMEPTYTEGTTVTLNIQWLAFTTA